MSFERGQSGNPGGRPKGVRNAVTVAMEHLLEGEAALAEGMGWSVRRVHKLARDLGACRILGNRMILLPEDVTIILESRKCPSKSTNEEKSTTTEEQLPDGDYEELQRRRARKLPSELPPAKSGNNGNVISMGRKPR